MQFFIQYNQRRHMAALKTQRAVRVIFDNGHTVAVSQFDQAQAAFQRNRITSYNVCYTKLLRARGRDMAAWLGLVPRQHSTGGKPVLGRVSKRGNSYLRQLFLQGAASANWGCPITLASSVSAAAATT